MILIGSYKRCCLMNLRYIIVERMDVKIEEIGRTNSMVMQKWEGKDLQEYIQAGPEMLSMCEIILEAVRKGM